jgi:hypothetical protein
LTLTLEIPETVESALEAKARRLGLPIERYAVEVLARDVAGSEGGEFLEMLAEATPRIAAGASRPISPDDISNAISDARP